MIDCVKELTDVHIKHPGIHIAALLSLGYGLMRSLALTIALGIFLEDRIAQQVVVSVLTPILEPIFKEDSYGYRPGKGAHQAIARLRSAAM